jgi:hypothetical protein
METLIGLCLVLLGIALAAFFGLMKAMGCTHCLKEAGVKTPSGDGDPRLWACVVDESDRYANHPDQWVEVVYLPESGKRKATRIYVYNMDLDDEGIQTYAFTKPNR